MGSVWVGSQRGDCVNLLPGDDTVKHFDEASPFGKAFYERSASYFVYPLYMVVVYNTVVQALATAFRATPPVLAIYLCTSFGHITAQSNPIHMMVMVILYSMPVYTAFSLVSLLIDIVAKWCLLGRRKPGIFSWDQSPYCQRWQTYLTLQEFRKRLVRDVGVLDLLQGSLYLVWFFRALGGKIGNNVCLYPNGGGEICVQTDIVNVIIPMYF
jgi:hypothetical protein